MAYNDAEYRVARLLVLGDATGSAVAGTGTAVELYRIPMTTAITVTDGAAACITGGTAASAVLTVGKSLAGTGAVSAITTSTWGTNADGTLQALTVTSTDLAAGDALVVQMAGTTGNTSTVQLVLEYFQDFG